MHHHDLSLWCHDHVFIGANQHTNERRTLVVIGLTATMMILEITSGLLFGSMALLADGWHMASHAAALGITALGYSFARRYAANPRFTFGTGKIGELAGFSSALLLAFIAILMAYESVKRFFSPVSISFDEAIAVAVLGLIVNVVSAVILRDDHREAHDDHHHVDHNLRAAYLHVLADALTSLLAILALSAGRFIGWAWMDPLMGIAGSIVIARWSYKLLRNTGCILLDMNTNNALAAKISRLLESESDDRISDLHVWHIGFGHFAAVVSIVTNDPRPPVEYKRRLEHLKEICHVTVEINPSQPILSPIEKTKRSA
ncbi:MAG: CDF family Co(II)/Ni(II) efflux transporter DmeF [Desulfobacteraceae bacterium]|jgi:cation diffusion facilitator family transporter